MRPDIAVKDDARRIVVDQGSLAVLALGMARVGEAFGGEVVREGDVVARPLAPLRYAVAGEARAGRRHILVDPPHQGAMIDDDIVRGDGRKSVGFPPAALRLAIDAGVDAQVADHDVVGLYVDAGADQRDPGPRRGLPGDGQKRVGDADRLASHVDDAADLEHDDARSGGLDRGLQRPLPVGRQRGHAQDLAAATADRVRGRTDRAGEGQRRRIGGKHRAGRQCKRQKKRGQTRFFGHPVSPIHWGIDTAVPIPLSS